MIRVILPAYNEAEALPALLARLNRTFQGNSLTGDVLVINDGSTDDTAGVVRNYTGRLRIRLHSLQPNRGLAVAVRTGLMISISECDPEDVIVTMDADNTHGPEYVPIMFERIEA